MSTQYLNDETDSDELLLGLLGAMKDEMVMAFDYRDVRVHRNGDWAVVSPSGPIYEAKGGKLNIDVADLEFAQRWVNNKADFYGDSQ